MDASYEPSEMETRTLFGLQMEQKRNNAVIDKALFTNITSKKTDVNTTISYSFIYYCLSVFRINIYLEMLLMFLGFYLRFVQC